MPACRSIEAPTRGRLLRAQEMSEAVLFEERATAAAARVAIATLNAEKTLNALSLEMVDLLMQRLTLWAADPEIAIVVLQGAGEKALCAGGDLHELYQSMRQHHASARSVDPLGNSYAAQFFGREYRLDYLIHSYPKPILCWGHGIVMGGGVGLMSGASHRVVTERSRIAMPEISIGLYPDVGGSWLLARVPRNAGLYLALTGAPLNGSDALFAGFADYLVESKRKADLIERLTQVPWTSAREDNDRLLGQLLRECASSTPPAPGPLQEAFERIAAVCQNADLGDLVRAILQLGRETMSEPSEKPVDLWLRQAATTLAAGSPGTARIAFTLQKRVRQLSLAQVFRIEYIVSLHCAQHTDFAEGIRALLIDKDKKPRWQPADLESASANWVEWFFASPWPAHQHPLEDLEHVYSPNAT